MRSRPSLAFRPRRLLAVAGLVSLGTGLLLATAAAPSARGDGRRRCRDRGHVAGNRPGARTGQAVTGLDQGGRCPGQAAGGGRPHGRGPALLDKGAGPAHVQPVDRDVVHRPQHRDRDPEHQPGQPAGAGDVDQLHPEHRPDLQQPERGLSGHGGRVQGHRPHQPCRLLRRRERRSDVDVRSGRPHERLVCHYHAAGHRPHRRPDPDQAGEPVPRLPEQQAVLTGDRARTRRQLQCHAAEVLRSLR